MNISLNLEFGDFYYILDSWWYGTNYQYHQKFNLHVAILDKDGWHKVKPYILQFLLILVGYLTYTTNLGIFENENSYFVEEEASGMETTISRTTARYYHFLSKRFYQERPERGNLTLNYTGTQSFVIPLSYLFALKLWIR